jgi:hypothetical protein
LLGIAFPLFQRVAVVLEEPRKVYVCRRRLNTGPPAPVEN